MTTVHIDAPGSIFRVLNPLVPYLLSLVTSPGGQVGGVKQGFVYYASAEVTFTVFIYFNEAGFCLLYISRS
ncbi:hypothetical protein CEXT_439321 [Caerostris extrusa]|uniref:Uncharacterized protein n=1 Tax=Caerostris extrusa TaxID=172846 RepID=A0AAV4TYY9_CAEEX|nr:hypothetical protein CEXT_439321 [Caerostris extrusa]